MIGREQITAGRIFAIATACTGLFFLLQDGFFTLDGWAHGANARLLSAVAAGDPAFEGLVRINPRPVPNWGGHVLLALFQQLMPALWAEKLLMALLVVVQATGCARYVKAISGRVNALIVLCLPALLGQVLVFGFYNFMFAMGVALWSAAWWLARRDDRWYQWPLLATAALLVYFCHGSGVPFFLLLLYCGTIAKAGAPTSLRAWFVWLGPAIACAPAMLLLVAFDRGQGGSPVYLGGVEVFRRITHFTWLAPYDGYRERMHVLLFVAALLSGTKSVVRGRWRSFAVQDRRWWPVFAGAVVLFAASFLLPDDTGYASYVSLRTVSLAFLLLTVGLAAQRSVHPHLARAGGVLALLSLLVALRFMAAEGAQARVDRDVVLRAAERFKPGDVVLPVWRDDRWLYQHRADLLGLARPVLLLENSQNNKRYCPLVWGADLPEAFNKVAHYADPGYAGLRAYMRAQQMPIVDHIVLMGPQLDVEEPAVKMLCDLADSLGFRQGFQERDVLVLSRP